MAEKRNRLKNELQEESSKKAAVSQETSTNKSKFSFISFKPGERTLKIFGLIFFFFSLCLFVAFVSFFITGGDDYTLVKDYTWMEVFRSSEIRAEIQNWFGYFGALLSNLFIIQGFGISSFAFVFLLFIFAWRILFKSHLINMAKSIAYSAFLIVFVPITLAFLISFFDTGFFVQSLSGNFGIQISDWLFGIVGKAGTGFGIVLVGLSAAVIIFNIDFKLPIKEHHKEELELVDGLAPTLENRPLEAIELEGVNAPVEFPLEKELENLTHDELENSLPFLVEPEETPDQMDLELEVEETLEEKIVDEKSDDEKMAASLVKEFGEYDPTLDLSSYKYPTLDLLENHGSGKISIKHEELEQNKNRIVQTLKNYSIEIASIKATVGPTVTLYEIIPKEGTRISKIKNLEDDIALSLAALGIRIIAPIPGKGTIGIEVPNQNPEVVSMRSILASEKFQNSTMDLPLALGRTISNEVFIVDLAKMPHLLMAGATGQGKSVGINALLVSLLYKKHPSQLKFVMVDPKKVELTIYRKIERHFLAKLPGEEEAIITDTKKVINTLNSLCIEMDQRYDLLKEAHVRNLKEYNQKFISRKLNPENGHRFLPYIVLVIDEFADLMMTAGKEIETPIARLAQLARAIGIHLVIATQRPSVNIITGTIKANFPARIAFRVSSKIDSRTILDTGGADQLIGRGDMLLSTGNDLIRLQCPFVDTPEAEKIIEFIGSQRAYPSAHILPEYVGDESEAGSKEFDADEKDSMFEEAARLIVRHQQGSTSLIQRKLKLGYNRAGRIIDQLESAGIVGPFEGSKAREVKYPDEYSLEIYLTELMKNKI